MGPAYNVIDSDGHVLEPLSMWENYIDPAFRERLLADGNAALAELGIDLSHWAPVKLRVVANGPGVHNLIVCTLCSCYPWEMLGLPPVWYKAAPYRSRAVKDPRGVLRDFGVEQIGRASCRERV